VPQILQAANRLFDDNLFNNAYISKETFNKYVIRVTRRQNMSSRCESNTRRIRRTYILEPKEVCSEYYAGYMNLSRLGDEPVCIMRA
jgi:hypothetical protein